MSIEVSGVTKRFGDFVALDNVNVSLPNGQLTALLGPSGGGKSTLLRIIAGLDSADAGTVSIEGVDATKLPPQKRNVGFVFQHYAVFKHMTVAKNVAFGLEIKGMSKAEIAEKVEWLLQKLHLQDFRNRYPKDLSGGMRQRVAIARVLALDSPILLMDEPFGALDALTRRTLQDELLRIWEEVGKTILFVTHSIEESIYLADRIIVMTYRPGTIKRDVAVDMPRPRDGSTPEFNRLKRELSQMVMEEQQRFSQDEIRSVTAD